jgi:L-ascorbate metabolism protein UlaG (beta-lactamase superfamily)
VIRDGHPDYQEIAMSQPKVTLIGGPTALIEIGGFRLLTDPTFDAPGEYRLPHVTLTKTSSPALTVQEVGPSMRCC